MSPAVRLTVLGASGSYPGPGAACSGYLVRAGGTAIAVDLGPGSLANLQHHCALGDLDAIVLTHSHPDHWTDLAGLEVAYIYDLGRTGVPVYGTPANRSKAEHLLDDLAPTFAWHNLSDGATIQVGDLEIVTSRTHHYVETYALAIRAVPEAGGEAGSSEAGSSETGSWLAYSADTGPGWSFAALDRPIALGVCEATFLADREDQGILHLSARQAGAMAAAAGVGRLVVTHLYPGVDPEAARAEASAAFGGPVEVAAPHATYEV